MFMSTESVSYLQLDFPWFVQEVGSREYVWNSASHKNMQLLLGVQVSAAQLLFAMAMPCKKSALILNQVAKCFAHKQELSFQVLFGLALW